MTDTRSVLFLSSASYKKQQTIAKEAEKNGTRDNRKKNLKQEKKSCKT